MTNPTPLSPAAQAIANAIEPLDWESGHCTYEDICFISRQVAAALRAAITAIGSEEIFHPNSKRTDGVKWRVQRVYAIADELEAQ